MTGLLLMLALVIVQAACAAQDNPVSLSPDGKGYRFDCNGWIYLHTEGSPSERGFQHGYLLAPELQDVTDAVRYLTLNDTGMPWEYFVNQSELMFVQNIDPEYIDEIKGIAAGANAAGTSISWQEVLAWNAYDELVDYWWPVAQSDVYANTDNHDHCSAFIATGSYTPDGSIVVAHNSWSPYERGRFMNLIHDTVPDNGNRILMQSLPGHIDSFTDYLVTGGGLVITETTIGSYGKYKANESPEFFRVRKAAQYANDLDSFVSFMEKKNSGGYANSWLVGDIKTGEIMRFEQGLKFSSVTKTKDGYFIGANYVEDARIRNLECSGLVPAEIRRSVGARMVRLKEVVEANRGMLTLDTGKTILSDHYDVWLQREQPSSRTIEGHYNLDPNPFTNIPFRPHGAIDGKITNTRMAKNMSFTARWGSSSGMPFDADAFLKQHPQFSYLEGYLPSFPTQPWTTFSGNDQPGRQAEDTSVILPHALLFPIHPVFFP